MKTLNSRNFGSATGRIQVNYHNGTSAVTGYISRQVGTNTFIVTSNGTTFYRVSLAQNTSLATTLTTGYCTLIVTPVDTGVPEHVKKIESKIVFTTEGNKYPRRLSGNVAGTAVHTTNP